MPIAVLDTFSLTISCVVHHCMRQGIIVEVMKTYRMTINCYFLADLEEDKVIKISYNQDRHLKIQQGYGHN